MGAIDAGLWVNFEEAGLSNYAKLNPLGRDIAQNLPYRGSQVLLAYDTTKLDPTNAPKTWPDLVAWIKANPGQFIYNRPNKGGSGGNFVRRAIYEANGNDPTKFTVDNYSDSFAEESMAPAWEILNDLAPSLFDGGAYTSGNTQSLQLLGQSAVTMIPAWSDQALTAIARRNVASLRAAAGLPLDEWARRCIADAVSAFPADVGWPCDMIVARPAPGGGAAARNPAQDRGQRDGRAGGYFHPRGPDGGGGTDL